MGRRIRGGKTAVIADLAAADKALERLGSIRRGMADVEAAAEEQITAAKTAAAAKIGPLKAEEESIVASLESFLANNRADILKGTVKSVTLNHGKMGYRKSSSTNWPDKEKVVERLEFLGFNDAVITDKKPNKAEIKRLEKDGLLDSEKDLGVNRKSGDVFFAEPETSGLAARTPAGA
jgi:phage host-nuclease inhibitor protein Gam